MRVNNIPNSHGKQSSPVNLKQNKQLLNPYNMPFGKLESGKEKLIEDTIKPKLYDIGYLWDRLVNTKAFTIDANFVAKKEDEYINNCDKVLQKRYNNFWKWNEDSASKLHEDENASNFALGLENAENPNKMPPSSSNSKIFDDELQAQEEGTQKAFKE